LEQSGGRAEVTGKVFCDKRIEMHVIRVINLPALTNLTPRAGNSRSDDKKFVMYMLTNDTLYFNGHYVFHATPVHPPCLVHGSMQDGSYETAATYIRRRDKSWARGDKRNGD
jgi:hypothetical protein